ncbi:hypothetical protein ABPG75_003851 [Micractinium tetrahymenae]
MAEDCEADSKAGPEDGEMLEGALAVQPAETGAPAEAEAGPAAVIKPSPIDCVSSPGENAVSVAPAAAGAATAGAPTAAQPPLTLPTSLAIKWQGAHVRPSQAALRLLRPGAAAMLHAVLASPTKSLATGKLEDIALDFLESLAEVTAQPRPPASITLWCRQLLQSCGLLSCRATQRSSRQWFVPAGRADQAAAAAAEVLGGLAASVSVLMESDSEDDF